MFKIGEVALIEVKKGKVFDFWIKETHEGKIEINPDTDCKGRLCSQCVFQNAFWDLFQVKDCQYCFGSKESFEEWNKNYDEKKGKEETPIEDTQEEKDFCLKEFDVFVVDGLKYQVRSNAMLREKDRLYIITPNCELEKCITPCEYKDKFSAGCHSEYFLDLKSLTQFAKEFFKISKFELLEEQTPIKDNVKKLKEMVYNCLEIEDTQEEKQILKLIVKKEDVKRLFEIAIENECNITVSCAKEQINTFFVVIERR